MFGKPIINSSMMRKDINMFQNNIIIHAAQLPVAGYGKSPSCFVVLHMNAISKTHRIRSDMEKLTAVNIARHRNDFQTILHIDIDDIPSPVQQGYVKNVRALIAAQDVQATDNEDIEDGHIRVDAAGSLIFYPPNLKEVFNKYVSCELSWLDDIKKIDWGRAEGKICALWAFLDIESYQRHHAPPSVR